MNRKIFTITLVALLATAPAFGVAAESAAEGRRALRIGVAAGGLVGAVAGGPPGAVIGMMLAGITTDQHLTAGRAATLEERAAVLEHERLSLLSERMRLKARADDLGRRLAHERRQAAIAAGSAPLANGLEFAVSFRTDSATPPEDATAGLDALASLLGATPSLDVRLDGYADPRGNSAHNQALSLARAAAIRDHLVNAGVEPDRIRVTAHGAIADPAGEPGRRSDDWALQRRVDVRLENHSGKVAANP
ncbi:MAG TPA: OmpA family protein [Gammaproteobacteria bacterium]|nr:OmpA family protein [Gammaproteobacteria bacterium]